MGLRTCFFALILFAGLSTPLSATTNNGSVNDFESPISGNLAQANPQSPLIQDDNVTHYGPNLESNNTGQKLQQSLLIQLEPNDADQKFQQSMRTLFVQRTKPDQLNAWLDYPMQIGAVICSGFYVAGKLATTVMFIDPCGNYLNPNSIWMNLGFGAILLPTMPTVANALYEFGKSGVNYFRYYGCDEQEQMLLQHPQGRRLLTGLQLFAGGVIIIPLKYAALSLASSHPILQSPVMFGLICTVTSLVDMAMVRVAIELTPSSMLDNVDGVHRLPEDKQQTETINTLAKGQTDLQNNIQYLEGVSTDEIERIYDFLQNPDNDKFEQMALLLDFSLLEKFFKASNNIQDDKCEKNETNKVMIDSDTSESEREQRPLIPVSNSTQSWSEWVAQKSTTLNLGAAMVLFEVNQYLFSSLQLGSPYNQSLCSNNTHGYFNTSAEYPLVTSIVSTAGMLFIMWGVTKSSVKKTATMLSGDASDRSQNGGVDFLSIYQSLVLSSDKIALAVRISSAGITEIAPRAMRVCLLIAYSGFEVGVKQCFTSASNASLYQHHMSRFSKGATETKKMFIQAMCRAFQKLWIELRPEYREKLEERKNQYV